MSWRIPCRLLFGIFLMLGLRPGAVADGPHPLFFFVMTDPQVGMYEHDQDLSREADNLEKFVAAANRLHPAFIVNCGDLVNKAGDFREIEVYRSIMAKLDPGIPVHNLAGNHDVHNHPTPESLAAYRRIFGPDYYTFEHDSIFGIVLDSSLMQYPDVAPREAERQAAWLGETLARARNSSKQVVVFQHISWFLHDAGEPDEYFNMPAPQRKEYLRRFEQAGIRYVFAGHHHENGFGTAGSIQMRTVSALGKPLGKDPSGFGIVVVEGDKLRFTYYALDAIPAQVN